MLSAILITSGPLILIIPIAPLPEAVAGAQMLSVYAISFVPAFAFVFDFAFFVLTNFAGLTVFLFAPISLPLLLLFRFLLKSHTYNILHVLRMREHINRLNGYNIIF